METTEKILASGIQYDPETGELTRNGKRAGWLEGDGYIRLMIEGRSYSAHRVAWLCATGSWPGGEVDHINGNRSDNRISNLREASSSQNGANCKRRKDNVSGFKGVGFHKPMGRWRARIKVGRKEKHLGYFDSASEAHKAYTEAACREFANFAKAN